MCEICDLLMLQAQSWILAYDRDVCFIFEPTIYPTQN